MPEPIKRPVVRIHNNGYSPAGHMMWAALCDHCDWQYANVAKTDVQWHAKMHREAHRAGRA